MVKNAKMMPKRYFGLHMLPGVAEYRDPGQEPYRIFLNEATIKKMDPSFEGKPVYVQHVEEVDLANLQNEADGYVVKSFYNEADGKHWAEFMVVSDQGHEAIAKGWRLSNAYIPKNWSNGGLWNGVEYLKEVVGAEYEHLALVPNPRYDESVIFTPDQFKEYCDSKRLEIKRLANSQGDKSVFKLFKKTKVENESELLGMSVILPKSQVEITVEKMINELDVVKNMHGYANGDHMVKVGDEEMSVNDLTGKYCDMVKKNAEAEEMKKKENVEGAEEIKKEDMKNEEEPKKKENDEDDEDGVQNSNFQKLMNANKNAKQELPVADTSMDKVARGKARYGSK